MAAAEIQHFTSPEAQKEVEGYKNDLKEIDSYYASIAKNADKLIKSQQTETKTQKQLIDAQKETLSTQKQLEKTKIKNKQATTNLNKALVEEKIKLQEQNKAIKDNVKENLGLVNAYDKLSKKHREAIRNAKDLAVKYGENSKQATKARKEANKYDSQLKSVDKSLGQHQRNVGNYSDALSAVGGKYGAVVSGMMGMTKAALAFIATPIGAVIAGIVVGLKLLSSFFTSSAEGQNKLNILSKTFTTILGNLQDLAASAGEKLYELFSNPKETLIALGEALKKNIVNRFWGLLELIPNIGKAIGKLFKGEFAEAGKIAADAVAKATLGVEDFSDKAVNGFNKATEAVKALADETQREVKIAQDLARRENALIKLRREQGVQVAKNKKEIQDLLLAYRDENQSVEERRKLIREANDIKRQELELNKQITFENYQLIKAQNELSNSTIEDLQKEADALTAYYDLQAQNAAQLRELKNRENELDRKIFAERAAEQAEIDKMINDELKLIETSLQEQNAIYAENENVRQELDEERTEKEKEEAEKRLIIARAEQQAKLSVAQNAFGAIAILAGRETALGKAAAIAATTINTYRGAQAAFAETPGGIAIKSLAALSATAIGLANLREIISVETVSAFDSGTSSTPSTYIAGEKRPEFRQHNGQWELLTQPTLFSDSAGDRIISGEKTDQILRGANMQANTGNKDIDTDKIVLAINNIPQAPTMNDRGIMYKQKKNGQLTKYLNSHVRRN